MNFDKLGLSKDLLKIIQKENFDEPTDIQEKAIPLVLKGKDIIAESATGSGKTLAFALGIIDKIEKGKGTQALILTPTRELAEQVFKEFRKFSKQKYLSVTVVYGGVAIGPQITRLKNADIVIGTPGRILDHIGRNSINLKKIKHFVLDEADVMLDMGFLKDVTDIFKACSPKKQTLLFSATITKDIENLSKKHMNKPVTLALDNQVDPKKLTQVYYDVAMNKKFSLLVHLLEKEKSDLVMVFCNSRKNVDFVTKNLKENGVHAQAIHGGFTQKQRNQAIEKFHTSRTDVLVCTDVAARGLDIKGVSHVYNYELPNDPKQYIHRIGRTARAGKEGKAVSLLSDREHDRFRRILDENKVEVENLDLPEFKKIMVRKEVESERGSFGGRSYRRSNGPSNYGSNRHSQGIRSHASSRSQGSSNYRNKPSYGRKPRKSNSY